MRGGGEVRALEVHPHDGLARELLPSLDNLDRALEFLQKAEEEYELQVSANQQQQGGATSRDEGVHDRRG